MTARLRPARPLLSAAAAALLGACGSSEPTAPPTGGPSLAGVWQRVSTGGERTLRLGADGSASSVDASFGARTCTVSAGDWSVDGARLTLTLAETGGSPVGESVGYQVFEDSLVLSGGDGAGTYRPVPALPSCDAYDFRIWTGTLSADVDGVSRTFANISVTTALGAGLLEIRACPDAGVSCQPGAAELILRIDAPPDPLATGSYPIQNNAIGEPNFFALIDTHPDDAGFPGFNTERLEPPGVFDLTEVGATRVAGTFEFRANEISEGLSAPDGRRFVLVTNGVVELDLS